MFHPALTFEAKPGGPKTFDFTVERPEKETVFQMQGNFQVTLDFFPHF